MTTQAVSRPRSNPYWVKAPLIAFLVTRLIVFAGAYLSDTVLPMVKNEEPRGAVGIWNRWDTVWYSEIADTGYSYDPNEKSSVAFFPLYPLLISVIKPVIGNTVAAGLLISNIAFLGALILLYRLTEAKFENRATAARTVFYIASFPTAFFFTAAYTESLFLLMSVGAAYAAHERRWGWAAVWGALCAATRSFGVLIWVLILLEWLASHGWMLSTVRQPGSWGKLRDAIRTDFRTVALICLIPVGLLLYMIYLGARFGDPIAFWTTQATWGFTNIGPIVVMIRDVGRVTRGELPYFTYLNILAFLAVVWIAIYIWRRLGAGYALYALLSVLLPMFSRTESMIRYILIVFPVFMMASRWGRNVWVDRLWRIVCLPFLALFAALFVKGVFIG
jgi:Gpi18-like mannosyltransferase